MHFIDPSSKEIIDALENHKNQLIGLVERRVRSSKTERSVRNFLTRSKIIEILESDPNQLMTLNDSFYSTVRNSSLNGYNIFKLNKHLNESQLSSVLKRNRTKYLKINKQVKRIFNYRDSFSKKESSYSTYELAKNLDINTCTYCNRLYTKTVIKPDKITRPDFDHWYPQDKYPLLALSFFNLIPSCHVCNSKVKGATELTTADFYHPYIDSEINFQFSYRYNKDLNGHKFKLNYIGDINNKAKNTTQAFKIKEIYETHEDEISDLLRIKHNYSSKYLLRLKKILKNKVSDDELYRLAFGTHLKESDFYKRPLSRMKRDILKELKIIN